MLSYSWHWNPPVIKDEHCNVWNRLITVVFYGVDCGGEGTDPKPKSINRVKSITTRFFKSSKDKGGPLSAFVLAIFYLLLVWALNYGGTAVFPVMRNFNVAIILDALGYLHQSVIEREGWSLDSLLLKVPTQAITRSRLPTLKAGKLHHHPRSSSGSIFKKQPPIVNVQWYKNGNY